jgi:hypothetical protein
MPSVFLIANSKTPKIKGHKLKELLESDPGNVVIGFNHIPWYNENMPLDYLYVRPSPGNYHGFDRSFRPLHKSTVGKIEKLIFINKNQKAIAAILKRTPTFIKKHEVIRRTKDVQKKYRLPKKPSSGMLVTDMMIQKYPNHKIVLVNFGFKGCAVHDWVFEKKICQRLAKKGKIQII